MSPLVWVGFLAFFFVALAVGIRLLWLAHRTRELPELCIGIGVLGIGPVGFGAAVAALQLEAGAPGAAAGLAAVGLLGNAAGVCFKVVFNWRVYHADNTGLRWLVVAGVLTYGVIFVVNAVRGFPAQPPVDVYYYARILPQVAALLWGAFEALRYWGLMRRRLRIGLADPVVTNRLLLWGIGAFSAGFGTLVGVVAQVFLGVSSAETPWVMASSSAHGFVAAVAMGLAFVPPRAYTRWVAAR